MDRTISKSETLRRRYRRIVAAAVAVTAAAGAVVAVNALMAPTVDASALKLADVDRGDIDVTVTGSGRVEPAFEEVINSPLSSRVVEIYHRSGDVVEAGTPLLRLDLHIDV